MNRSVYEAARLGAIWRDMSHFGRFRVVGKDAAALLHHLTTADIKRLKRGDCCDAALISNRARLLDWLTIARDDEGFTVITSPNRREMFVPHARRFILFRQDVTLRDDSGRGALYAVFGDDVPQMQVPEGVYTAPSQRLPGQGLWLWSEEAAKLHPVVNDAGLPSCDPETFNVLRVEEGLPVAGAELTEDVNPWEAGLDASISLAKGCYNGQEVVARLNTYKKVKQRLSGLKLERLLVLAPGERAALRAGSKDAGFITSAVDSPRFGPIALGYVRTEFQANGQNIEVVVPDAAMIAAEVTLLPFAEALVNL